MSDANHKVTELLKEWCNGNEAALERLTPMVYGELHRLAGLYMARERHRSALQTTALVNEAYLHIVDCANISWQNRAHFFAVCARIMRRVLVDLARTRGRAGRALLVGGGVRDMLLNHVPKDFNIATDAHPEQVKRLFGNCRLIGRRFRLAHVFYGRDIVEVATFRAGQDVHEDDDDAVPEQLHVHLQSDSGRILRDNVYGTIEEGAWRRDFTFNALYYDIADYSVVDYVGAMDDIKHRVLRLIGDPVTRYREDPVRMLRAVRFAAKLGFTIHPASEQPIYDLGHLLADIPPVASVRRNSQIVSLRLCSGVPGFVAQIRLAEIFVCPNQSGSG